MSMWMDSCGTAKYFKREYQWEKQCFSSEKPTSELKPDCEQYFWKGYAILFFTHGYGTFENSGRTERYKTRMAQKEVKELPLPWLWTSPSFPNERKKCRVYFTHLRNPKFGRAEWWSFLTENWAVSSIHRQVWALRTHADLTVNRQASLNSMDPFLNNLLFIHKKV